MTEDVVLITDRLWQRSSSPANLETENQVLRDLERQLTQPPQVSLQHWAEVAEDPCQVRTSGASLIETSPHEKSRWAVLASVCEGLESSMISSDSLGGNRLAQSSIQLYSSPTRYSTDLPAADATIVATLVLLLVAESGKSSIDQGVTFYFSSPEIEEEPE